jgi:26 proteasome complex subunit DSS1
MSNVNPQSNNLKYIPPKDEDKEKEVKKTVAPLEEDDEFEDFPVEGTFSINCSNSDWGEDESQSQYTKPVGEETAQPLWAEEWEDDTEETDFAVQLKYSCSRDVLTW